MYQKIGWWKGPNASDEARTLVCKFWQDQGDQGITWLVSRLRSEGHTDLLDGVASILRRSARLRSRPFLTSWSVSLLATRPKPSSRRSAG